MHLKIIIFLVAAIFISECFAMLPDELDPENQIERAWGRLSSNVRQMIPKHGARERYQKARVILKLPAGAGEDPQNLSFVFLGTLKNDSGESEYLDALHQALLQKITAFLPAYYHGVQNGQIVYSDALLFGLEGQQDVDLFQDWQKNRIFARLREPLPKMPNWSGQKTKQ